MSAASVLASLATVAVAYLGSRKDRKVRIKLKSGDEVEISGYSVAQVKDALSSAINVTFEAGRGEESGGHPQQQ